MKPIAATYTASEGKKQETGAILAFVYNDAAYVRAIQCVFMTSQGKILRVSPSEVTVTFPKEIMYGKDA